MELYNTRLLGVAMIEMKRITIILLQIITLLLMVSNHFLSILVNKTNSKIIFMGWDVRGIILDVLLYSTIGLQLLIIALLINYKTK